MSTSQRKLGSFEGFFMHYPTDYSYYPLDRVQAQRSRSSPRINQSNPLETPTNYRRSAKQAFLKDRPTDSEFVW